jgi:hypothetical protein
MWALGWQIIPAGKSLTYFLIYRNNSSEEIIHQSYPDISD